jgi:hypothetical protein
MAQAPALPPPARRRHALLGLEGEGDGDARADAVGLESDALLAPQLLVLEGDRLPVAGRERRRALHHDPAAAHARDPHAPRALLRPGAFELLQGREAVEPRRPACAVVPELLDLDARTVDHPHDGRVSHPPRVG